MKCSLCNETTKEQEPAILTVGAYGVPRYICETCAADIDTITSSRELDNIKEAFDRLTDKIAVSSYSDEAVNRAMTEILEGARQRAEAIKMGTYDFSLDFEGEEVPDEIPEELLETEEDIEADEKDAERNKKIDKVFNVIYFLMFLAAIVFLIIRFAS